MFVGVGNCLTLEIQYGRELPGEANYDGGSEVLFFPAGAVKGVNGGPQNVRLRISIKLRTYIAGTIVICLLYPN